MQVQLYRVCRGLLLATLVVFVVSTPEAMADKKRGKHHGHSHGRGRGNSGFQLGFSPAGISYGYHSRGFSIGVGPAYNGYGYGNNGFDMDYGYPPYGSAYYDGPYISPYNYGYYDEPYGYGYGAPAIEYVAPVYEVFPAEPTIIGLTPQAQSVVAPVVNPTPSASTVIPTNQKAAGFQRNAEQAFQDGKHHEALRLNNHAILEDNGNGKLLLFRAQSQFATGDYVGAVASLEQAIDRVPARESGFVVERFRRLYKGTAYVDQMDRLVKYIEANPTSREALSLLAYQYTHLGHKEAARELLSSRQGFSSDTPSKLERHLTTALRVRDLPSRPTPATLPSPPPNSDSSQ